MAVELPHFAFPFVRGQVLEQDSDQHVLSCLYVIAHCPVGFRVERPEFGIPWLDYRTRVDPAASIEDNLLEFEPRADMQHTIALRDLLEAGSVARMTFEVEVDSG